MRNGAFLQALSSTRNHEGCGSSSWSTLSYRMMRSSHDLLRSRVETITSSKAPVSPSWRCSCKTSWVDYTFQLLVVNSKYGYCQFAPPRYRAGQSNLVFSYQFVNGLAINTMCMYVCMYVCMCACVCSWRIHVIKPTGKSSGTQDKGSEL